MAKCTCELYGSRSCSACSGLYTKLESYQVTQPSTKLIVDNDEYGFEDPDWDQKAQDDFDAFVNWALNKIYPGYPWGAK